VRLASVLISGWGDFRTYPLFRRGSAGFSGGHAGHDRPPDIPFDARRALAVEFRKADDETGCV
jgi:hypothetical protein